MMREMDRVITSTNMQLEIEAHYENMAKHFQEEYEGYDHLMDPETDPKYTIAQKTPKNIPKGILKWAKPDKDEL